VYCGFHIIDPALEALGQLILTQSLEKLAMLICLNQLGILLLYTRREAGRSIICGISTVRVCGAVGMRHQVDAIWSIVLHFSLPVLSSHW
jgi:hypothetical protein